MRSMSEPTYTGALTLSTFTQINFKGYFAVITAIWAKSSLVLAITPCPLIAAPRELGEKSAFAFKPSFKS